MREAAIEVSGVSYTYDRARALDGVTFDVGRGELFGLIGPDGAGKSTLYSILATLAEPGEGSAKISGLDVVTDSRRLRSVIGYMPEKFSLYPDMSVMENLRFFASLYGTSVEECYQLIEPVFRQLARFPDRMAGALSGGMKQKLALSCALAHRPSVLLLDEPTTGVDAVSRSEFWEVLRALRDSGMTILVSTSYMDEASLCDRVAMINNGRVFATDTPEALVSCMDGSLYEARSAEMFRLLGVLRSTPGVADCYTFGASIHLAVTDDFDSEAAKRRLAAAGIPDADITPAKATIEDLFIKLTS
ncbi:MAG: ABC transporter ATP-binding protein [[Clostridium] fimetarium]|nr:ABC transporter ATP-binding protein [Alistipes timonensis]MCM1404834.1 ABC transporter ATP-binding protein [[Clostridium] fimetarium]